MSKRKPAILMGSENQQVNSQELLKIRRLTDFDLIMLISEIHDHGWHVACRTLELMPEPSERIPDLTERFPEG